RFARELQSAQTYREATDAAQRETARSIGYRHAWILAFDVEDDSHLRLLSMSGPLAATTLERAPSVPVEGDALIREMVATRAPVVVTDARTDPRVNRQLVRLLGFRTIVNVPLSLPDRPFGVFGVGTFGDEGPKPPTPVDLARLAAMAGHLAAALARVRLEEERREAERRHDELEEQLRRLRRLETWGLVAGGVAHDFNNLLTVILGAAHLLDEGGAPEDAATEVRRIRDAAERGRALTAKLLAIGGRQPAAFRPVDPAARLAAARERLARVIPPSVTVVIRAEPSLPHIAADLAQVDQLLMNLSLNARDALPRGGRITLSADVADLGAEDLADAPWATPGRFVRLTVEDDGEGMTPDVLERMFEPFFTTKGPDRGAGLGLAVTRGIARRHGGFLRVRSELGRGSCFETWLPAASPAGGDPAPAAEAPRARRGRERILVVDDESAVRELFTRVLRRAGYVVATSEDGRAAVDAARREDFDLFLLDVLMPRLDGFGAYAEPRTLKVDPRVLFLSGYAPDESGLKAIDGRRVRHLSKPVSPAELLRAVRDALDA
ncbi:MAG TPA: response regulator, partial [Planctomycetota bacterium]|nr:response regulator [Planctomycetota bacterium]